MFITHIFSLQNLAILYQNVLDCLRDPELPVRVQAALALQLMVRHDSGMCRRLVKMNKFISIDTISVVYEAIKPNLPFIMQELLNLTNEIDLDILVTVMENFVKVFAEQLTPFAVELCTQLSNTFLRIMEELVQINARAEDAAVEESEDKMMTVMGVVKTIKTFILSLEGTLDILQQLENALLPVITLTLEKCVLELYEEIFEIIQFCTSFSETVSPTMWRVFEMIYVLVKKSEHLDMQQMLPSLENFIAYGKDVLVSNDQIKQMLFDMIERIMRDDSADEKDKVCGSKLMEIILLHCRGSVDMVSKHIR